MSGWKTYAVAGAGALLVFVHSMGWIDDSLFATLGGLLGAGGLAALRHGISSK